MASIGLINLGILPLLLEAMTPGYALYDQLEQEPGRQQQAQDAKAASPQSPERVEKPQRPHEPKPQGQPRPEARPEGQPRPNRANRREGPQQQPGPGSGRQAPAQPVRRAKPPSAPSSRPAPHAQPTHEGQHQSAWPTRRARDWKTEHRTWQDRGGYRGYRIPDDRFHGSFGPSHGFRMFLFPLIVIGGFPRFQFNGLWFSVMDPWPEYWSETWYGDDELYIEYWEDGYYLLNRRHPMDRIAITVLVG